MKILQNSIIYYIKNIQYVDFTFINKFNILDPS